MKMTCDVRDASEKDMLIVYNKFKQFKPEVKWSDERPSLLFKNGRQEFRINNIYFPHESLSIEFYTGTDNIRFDCRIKLTEEIKAEILKFVKHGTSKSVLDYI
jgi:hypothetical protein